MRFPRCLNCSTVLFLRKWNGRQKKYIICSTCGLQYARATIMDADPYVWDRVRERRSFTLKKDHRGRLYLLLNDGLGSRRK